MRQKKRLGEMLVEGGLLTEAQLSQALVDQKKADMKLGQYLIYEGILSESQIVDAISVQLKIKKYHPNQFPIDLNLATIMSVDTAQKFQSVPLKKDGYLLTIAMTDPMDLNAMDTIEVETNCEVEPVICTEQEMNTLIGRLYGSFTDIDGILGEVNDPEFESGGESSTAWSGANMEVGSLQDMAEDAPVVRLVNSILTQAVRDGASDVHISPEKDKVQVRFRMDGKLHEVPAPPKSMFLAMVSRLKILANLDIAVSRIPQDGRFSVRLSNKEINVRVSTVPTIYGENVVMRILDTSSGVFALEKLGMSTDDCKKIETMVQKPYGMILSTGPTGCGKTTSLYSILKNINQPDINIITLEDPVEYRVDKIRQVQLNHKAGMTFASGLRAILRQDPDVIMVGEIRDSETATIAVQAALTGHRVLSTVHTNDAAGAVTRFIDMGIEPFLVSSVMLVSIAQRLVRRVCSSCGETYTPQPEALASLGINASGEHTFLKGRGCINCMETGYKGRTGLYEVLVIDDDVQEMILQNKSAQEINRAARESGTFKTLQEDAADKVRKGITTVEEALSAVMT